MKKQNKALIAFLAAAIGLVGLAGVASARGGCYGGGPHGPGMGPGIKPEVMEIVQKAHTAMAPVYMELQAKKQELTAKIYSGADDAAVKGLVSEIGTLQNRLTEAGADMHKQLVKAGVPLNPGMMNCPAIGGGYRHGGQGFHGRHGGMGAHGMGGCPGMGNAPSSQQQ